MIEHKEVAAEVSNLMIEISRKLDRSIALVQEKCTTAEFVAYRRAAANIMGDVLLDVMNPLYLRHPDLKPEGLK